jgi:hypothetical protein
MKRKPPIPAAGIFLLAVAAIVSAWPRPETRHHSHHQAKPQAGRLHPALQVMLKQPVHKDDEQQSPFFRALAALVPKSEQFADADEGYAAALRTGRDRLVVVVVRGSALCIPGDDTQSLLLFHPDGRLLDSLSCSINNRLTRMFVDHLWTFGTHVLEPADRDGACLVIRCSPPAGEVFGGNWSHDLTHGGRTWTYPWDPERPGAIPSSEWVTKGLCRVAVRGNKFKCVFPDFKSP